MGEEDFLICARWYGGEMLLLGVGVAFNPVEDTVFAVSPTRSDGVTRDIELAGDGMFKCVAGGVGSWGGSSWEG